jgi:WASH complex subunit 7
MDTTVNFVYQFLGRKFFVFSQFLFDDHIKSPLIKETRFYKERRDELDQMYPVERALEFLKGIRKLGLIQDKKNYIDMFRELITEIGNSLGYVRMVRSGALHHISNAVTFVPDLEDIIPFEETVKEDGLSGQTVAAARNVDQILGDLTEKFTGSADYFKIFVEVFQKEFQKEANLHLRNFYTIVPPLTLSFLDHIITLKDRMDKRGRDGIFSDDGFALGTVFILKVLDQNVMFDSLHWFPSLRKHYTQQLKKVTQKMASIPKKKGSDDELQTLRLTQSRVEIYQREVLLLDYAFSGARVFFR